MQLGPSLPHAESVWPKWNSGERNDVGLSFGRQHEEVVISPGSRSCQSCQYCAVRPPHYRIHLSMSIARSRSVGLACSRQIVLGQGSDACSRISKMINEERDAPAPRQSLGKPSPGENAEGPRWWRRRLALRLQARLIRDYGVHKSTVTRIDEISRFCHSKVKSPKSHRESWRIVGESS
jgi:hypothetical protein